MLDVPASAYQLQGPHNAPLYVLMTPAYGLRHKPDNPRCNAPATSTLCVDVFAGAYRQLWIYKARGR